MASARPPPTAILTAEFTFDLELVLLTLFLVSLVVVGIVVVIRVKRWRTESDEELVPRIDHYRALLEQGILAPEEFERIRKHLEARPVSAVPSGLPSSVPSPPSDPTAFKPAEPPPT
ncbi:MAG: hypothetical protein HY040_21730 [Planctomycetes bacterium]|nr:hypothetical protein [Planctomycetota bacterium]